MSPFSKPKKLLTKTTIDSKFQNRLPVIKVGDRVAFITMGPNPRTLCAVVTDATARDSRGRPIYRVQASGRTYIARPKLLCRLNSRKSES